MIRCNKKSLRQGRKGQRVDSVQSSKIKTNKQINSNSLLFFLEVKTYLNCLCCCCSIKWQLHAIKMNELWNTHTHTHNKSNECLFLLLHVEQKDYFFFPFYVALNVVIKWRLSALWHSQMTAQATTQTNKATNTAGHLQQRNDWHSHRKTHEKKESLCPRESKGKHTERIRSR